MRTLFNPDTLKSTIARLTKGVQSGAIKSGKLGSAAVKAIKKTKPDKPQPGFLGKRADRISLLGSPAKNAGGFGSTLLNQ